ncbi:MAG: glutathione S-transferase family protein [Cyanobacteria bacterium J06614_10]
MKLYYFPPSNNSRRAQAIALHLELPVEYELIDLQAGKQRTDDFLALNPAGRIPVLRDGDFVLWESNAIAQYLASKDPTSLWPDDPQSRASVTGWQCWEMAHFSKGTQPLQFERFVKQVLNLGDPDPQVVQHALEIFHREASILNAHLAQHAYLVNDTLTIADFSVASDLTYAIPCQFPLENYPHIRDWYARIDSLPAWQKTAPQQP